MQIRGNKQDVVSFYPKTGLPIIHDDVVDFARDPTDEVVAIPQEYVQLAMLILDSLRPCRLSRPGGDSKRQQGADWNRSIIQPPHECVSTQSIDWSSIDSGRRVGIQFLRFSDGGACTIETGRYRRLHYWLVPPPRFILWRQKLCTGTTTLPPVRNEVHYTGRVQGVGLRFSTQTVAAMHPVVGYVENLVDGRVRVIVEGEADAIEVFLGEVAATMARYIHEVDVKTKPASDEFFPFRDSTSDKLLDRELGHFRDSR